MIIEGADYFVRMVALPPHVRGIVAPNDDGTFNMYLDPRSGPSMLLDTYFHELEHIEYDDFYSDKPIEEIEGR